MIYLYEETKRLTEHQLFLLEQTLPASMQTRIQDMKSPKAREESVIGYALLFYALFEKYGWEKEKILIQKGKYGKPFLFSHPDVFFNLSHSNAKAACVLGKKENGIDLQKKITFQNRLEDRICSMEEKRRIDLQCSEEEKSWILTKIWAAKEAYLKKKGTGIRENLRLLQIEEKNEALYCLNGENIRLWKRGEFILALCTEEKEDKILSITIDQMIKRK